MLAIYDCIDGEPMRLSSSKWALVVLPLLFIGCGSADGPPAGVPETVVSKPVYRQDELSSLVGKTPEEVKSILGDRGYRAGGAESFVYIERSVSPGTGKLDSEAEFKVEDGKVSSVEFKEGTKSSQ